MPSKWPSFFPNASACDIDFIWFNVLLFRRNDYNSVFKYSNSSGGREGHVLVNMNGGREREASNETVQSPSFLLIVTSW